MQRAPRCDKKIPPCSCIYVYDSDSMSKITNMSTILMVPKSLARNFDESELLSPRKVAESDKFENMLSGIAQQRYYYRNIETFRQLLKEYNAKGIEKEGPLEFAAWANVAVKMCSVCGDGGKKKSKSDQYYVYPKEKAHSRTILCHGCVGFRLRQFKARMGSKRTRARTISNS